MRSYNFMKVARDQLIDNCPDPFVQPFTMHPSWVSLDGSDTKAVHHGLNPVISPDRLAIDET